MEIKVLENTKSKFVLELQGEDHTLANALKAELLQDKQVKAAGYSVNHPNIGTPRLVVEAGDPKKALQEAVKRLRKENEKLGEAFKKALK